jgi:hypothetical protein
MMRSNLACVLVVGVFLFLLVVLSYRLCRSGKATPAVTTPPRAKRDSPPFAGLPRKPNCPVCVTDCNRNQPGLQSARFPDHIKCLYRPAQDRIMALGHIW